MTRIGSAQAPAFGRGEQVNRTPWHQWFAWRPAFTDDRGYVWLRRVWRRHVPPRDVFLSGMSVGWTWDYSVVDPREGQ